jgi:hypothetical protein
VSGEAQTEEDKMLANLRMLRDSSSPADLGVGLGDPTEQTLDELKRVLRTWNISLSVELLELRQANDALLSGLEGGGLPESQIEKLRLLRDIKQTSFRIYSEQIKVYREQIAERVARDLTNANIELNKSSLELTKSSLELTKSSLELTKSSLELTKSNNKLAAEAARAARFTGWATVALAIFTFLLIVVTMLVGALSH